MIKVRQTLAVLRYRKAFSSGGARSAADLRVQQQRVRAVLREQQVLQLRQRAARARRALEHDTTQHLIRAEG